MGVVCSHNVTYICHMEIYKITNKITGEYYIGLNSTSDPKYLGSGTNIRQQVDKYGKENFIKEILCLITSSSTDKDTLRQIEHLYISNHINNKKCINIAIGYTKGASEKIVYKDKIIYKEKIVYKEKIIHAPRLPSRRLANLLKL